MEKIESEQILNKPEINEEEKTAKNVADNFTNLFYYGQAKSALRNYAGKHIEEYELFNSVYAKVDKKHFENFYLRSDKNRKDSIKITYLNRKLFRIDVLNKSKEGPIDDKYQYVADGIYKISFNNIKGTIGISKHVNGKSITDIYKNNEVIKTIAR